MTCEVIAEVGINHSGSYRKALQMILDAHRAGCKCVKFQAFADDYIVPPDAMAGGENLADLLHRCTFADWEDAALKTSVENMGMEYLSTPFSPAAAYRLERMGVKRYKIGSGQCGNFELVEIIASFGKPVILSTGMSDWTTIDCAVELLKDCPLTILHCVSEYPTPYEHVNLPRMLELKERYGKPVGLSDHSQGIATALAAVALGASVVEKHFTSDKNWPGPDIQSSIDPRELQELMEGSAAICGAMNHA